MGIPFSINIFRALLSPLKTLRFLTAKSLCFLIVLLWMGLNTAAYGQETVDQPVDTIPKKTLRENHSPRKATMLSAAFPGLGQAYNKKYWKMPIVYAGFGTLGYFIYTNNAEYKSFRDAYLYRMDDNPATVSDIKFKNYSDDGLKRGRDYYRRNLEVSWIFTGLFYVLNILDATVDAHLADFDVSENLSMKIEPQIIFAPSLTYAKPLHPVQPGLKLTFKF